jgi:hypothetical protein
LKEEGLRPSSTKESDWFVHLSNAAGPTITAGSLYPTPVFQPSLSVLLPRCREKISDSSHAAPAVIAFVKAMEKLCGACMDPKNHDLMRATFLALVLRTELVVDGRALPTSEDDIEDRLASFLAAPTARCHTLLRPDDDPKLEKLKAHHAKMRPSSTPDAPDTASPVSVPAKSAKTPESDTDKKLTVIVKQMTEFGKALTTFADETTGRLTAVEKDYKKTSSQLGKIVNSTQGRQYPTPTGVDPVNPK